MSFSGWFCTLKSIMSKVQTRNIVNLIKTFEMLSLEHALHFGLLLSCAHSQKPFFASLYAQGRNHETKPSRFISLPILDSSTHRAALHLFFSPVMHAVMGLRYYVGMKCGHTCQGQRDIFAKRPISFFLFLCVYSKCFCIGLPIAICVHLQ